MADLIWDHALDFAHKAAHTIFKPDLLLVFVACPPEMHELKSRANIVASTTQQKMSSNSPNAQFPMFFAAVCESFLDKDVASQTKTPASLPGFCILELA